MKSTIAMIVVAAVLAPAAASAQVRDAVSARRVVRIVEQTQAEQREQERIRQAQERARQQQERGRAAERARQSSRDQREEQTEKISRTFKIGSSGELDVSNLAGDITIRRGGGDVQVEATKIARARTAEEAREMLTYVRVDFIERGSRAEVRTVYPRPDQWNSNRRNISVSVEYSVTAPEGTRISAKSLSGDIRVTDIKGDLNVASTSGDVIVENGARVMMAKSTSGDVEILNLRSEIAFQAHTLSGGVIVRQSRAPRMELNTISGDLMITDVQCERLEAQTLSGNLELNASLSKNGRYELNSHSGTIRIVPAGNIGFELDANSFSGNIQSELALKDQRQGTADYGRRGQGGRTRSLRGVYGDGSALLDITTFSGNVLIVKK